LATTDTAHFCGGSAYLRLRPGVYFGAAVGVALPFLTTEWHCQVLKSLQLGLIHIGKAVLSAGLYDRVGAHRHVACVESSDQAPPPTLLQVLPYVLERLAPNVLVTAYGVASVVP
jgi:hypothetical protein